MVLRTGEDIAELIEEGSWTRRAKTLERLAARFSATTLAKAERRAILDAFRIALYDAEPMVRRVLAESVKLSSELPSDILLALAHDIASVAAPVLEHSCRLSEDELLAIVLDGTTAHRFAVAGRRLLSGRVAEALCRFRERNVILRLLANDGAAISEAALHGLLDAFNDQAAVAEAIARRRLLPVSVAGRLFAAAPRRSESLGRPRTGSLG
jgi:uncharacterized protein (DUF2336 family)